MAKKPTVTTLASGFNSTETLNANFEALRDGFDNTLSLDGSTPNAMGADLDLNGNNIIGAAGLLINGTDYLADVAAAKAAALVAQAAAETAETNAETAETNAEASETAVGLSATAAATSATASELAKTGAELAETNAETAESNASTSATSAATSASTASTGASTATTKASEAATSATASASSASAASSSETAASTSESNASTSETNAATSATSAATSATASATSATAAAASEAGVDADRVAAQAAAATATTKASEASTSETNAATSASTATTKASEAATSATNAATSATESETAKTAAEAAKDAALAALDSFDDRYLGAKASDPTTDNDGNALVAGALYYNTTSDVMKVYEGSVWVAAYASLSGALLATNNLSDLTNATSARTNLGLGTAAATASTDYATAAQGTLAASAVQPNDSPTFAGLTTTADVSFGDNDKAIFGAGSDLQIYHDGSNSYIKEAGQGALVLQGTHMYLKSTADEYYLKNTADGSVEVYHNGSSKLATTSTGIDVTGTVTADGLTVAGIIETTGGTDINMDATASGQLKLDGNGYGGAIALNAQGMNIYTNSAYRDLIFGTNETERVRIDSSGNVGIGKTNPATALDVNGNITASGTDPTIYINETDTSANHRILSSAGALYIQAEDSDGTSDGDLHLTGMNNNDLSLLNIKAVNTTLNGQVGIGTDNPEYVLDIKAPDNVTTTMAMSVQNASRNYGLGIGAYSMSNRNIGGSAATVGYTFDIGGAATFKTNNVEAMTINSSQTVELNGRLTLPTATYHYSSDGKARLYYYENGDTLFRTADDFLFRNNANTTVAQIYDTGAIHTISTVTATSFILGDWTVTESSGVLHFATGGVNKMKLDATGNLTVVGNVTAYGTI